MIVKGRVQGVGYRYFCLRHADLLNLTGWVKNQSDNTVELEVQGEDQTIARFLKELRSGPALAQVTDIILAQQSPVAGEKSFLIV